MLSICGGGGSAVAAGEEFRALHPLPSPQPHPQQLGLGGAIDTLLLNPFQVDEGTLLEIAQQRYNAGDYRVALEHCNALYAENPRNLENLLLLGAVYYQLREFDMCIAKNEEAIAIQPNFPECFDNMANAWREKGDIDRAIQYYEHAIQLRPTFADAFSNLASAYTRRGNLMEATKCCHQALALNPRLVDAYCNLGDILKAQGSYREAYNCYKEAVSITPSCASAWYNIAGIFMQWGDFNKAVLYYKEAIKFKPTFYDAHMNLGNLYKAVGMFQDAIVCYLNAAQASPQNAIAYGNLGDTYYERGQLDLAILSYRHAITCSPSYVEAYNNLGNVLKESGRNDEAIGCYQTCLALQPNHPQALTNLGNVYMEMSMMDMAVSHFMKAVTVTTGLSAPYNNLAIIYKQQGNYANAIACYNEVLRVDPLAADSLVNRGNTLKEAGRVNEAIQDYFRAATIRPTMAEAHANLAYAYKDTGLMEAAIISFKQALQLRPDFPQVTCNLLHSLQCVCDWDDRDAKFAEVEGIIKQQIKACDFHTFMSLLPSVQPFHAMAFPIDPTLALEISKKYAEHYSLIASRFRLPVFAHPARVPIMTDARTSRLRIGYVSSDFGNHPLSHLMGSVFGMHNKDTVEVFCYALSRDDGTEWRQRIKGEAEHFIDVSMMSSDMIAKTINEDKIQILINLNGYTKGARNEIFAMQPAPIQVSYMGFPATTGASYIDYLITDEFVSPLEYSHIYSENLVHLPHCYFVNDYKQKNQDVLYAVCPHKRADYGLPEDKFIFACFNQLYKMDPDIFNTWCNILNRVPNSALWLLRFPAAGEMRLRSYAISKGVRADQIIFTEVAAKNEHIKRSALADLFLDTPLCNGHTTGTDVLWAGLPMVTLPLEKMATRVAGSLCLATGVGEEMIVNSLKEYEERAVFLANNPSKLQALRSRLKAVRMTCPLFDTARWVRNLERAYFKMWHLYRTSSHPHHFKVVEDDASL
ncbi:hypothetical protein EJB05_17976 [Eragrostis curvula]|uniref:protein O-GlcNAc transferase n=1 Tax=Eragrostis curvula TaxID=38414 RepID=A0A5J9VIV2_9POAL|nr:hypothetical protein EJB05_17976 [Eragrostis curvula]